MDIDRIQLDPNGDIFSLTSTLTPDQEKLVTDWMGQTYHTFVSKAAESRNQDFDTLEAKARGRIYTGAQALDEGLVDSLGGVSTAVAEMKDVLGLAPSAQIRLEIYPKPKSVWQTLTSGELFHLRASSLVESLTARTRMLERPAVWMLAPEVQIN